MQLTNVMIVEDDPMVGHVNARFLKRIPGFHLVNIASNLTEAKETIRVNNIQLILLDVFLPRESGINFLKWIRKEEIRVDIILITADKTTETVQEAFRYGAIDYLIKPFNFERFKEALLQYKERQTDLESADFIEQESLDKYIFSAKGETPIELEKGLNKYTYKLIWDVFIQSEHSSYTADELAEILGIARVTVRRYLEYMDREGKLELYIEYGKVGRPQHKYRWKNPLEGD